MKVLSIIDKKSDESLIKKRLKDVVGIDLEFVVIDEISGDFAFFIYDGIYIKDTYENGNIEDLLDFVRLGNSAYKSLRSVYFVVEIVGKGPNLFFKTKAERVYKLGIFKFGRGNEIAGIFKKLIVDEVENGAPLIEKEEEKFVPRRVLVIDDSKVMLGIAAEAFNDKRFILFTAKDGKEGLAVFLKEKPDIVLTDVFMPHISGIELCKIIKSNETSKNTPVLIISESSNVEVIDQGYAAGADSFLFKTMTPEAIRNKTLCFFSENESIPDFKMLLVDEDSKETREMSSELRSKGLLVLNCENGLDALYTILRKKPDVVVTEILLPLMDGFELSSKIRGIERIKATKIVFRTKRSDERDKELADELGVVQIFNKPVDGNQVFNLMKQMIVNKINFYQAEYNLVLASIQSLAAALDARDEYTRGHSERVKNYSIMIAESMGMYQEDIDILARAADLHDIGKIGIKDDVLLKEGALTKEEYELIKQHPTIAHKILSPLSSLTEVSKIILHHHERWDGKGYPDGLKERAIPLSARIVAVADTYDAITSNRPYRKSIPKEDALRILEEVKGTQLCPLCVTSFLKLSSNLED